MLNLIPVENWEYHFSDVIKNFFAILNKKSNESLDIKGLGKCIPARSARAAIITALKTLDLPAGSNIGVPLYCCHVVFKAIIMAGHKPCFIDIDPETYCMSLEDLSLKRSRLNAIISVHMFGNICDMNEFKSIAGDIPIIEDCAQSIGSKFNSQMAGSFGDIAVFSFRSGKYLSVGEGGALYTENADLRSRLLQVTSELPMPAFKDECAHIVKTYLRSMLRSKPLYGPIGYPLWSIYNKNVEYSEKATIEIGQIYKSDLATTNRRLVSIDKTIERQRANAEFYSQSLNLDPDMLCHEMPGSFYNRYLYPILFRSREDCEFMATYLHSRQIDTSRSYKDMPEVAAKYYEYKGDCPNTHNVAERILAIPSHYNLRQEEIQRIAQWMNAGLKKIADRSHFPSL